MKYFLLVSRPGNRSQEDTKQLKDAKFAATLERMTEASGRQVLRRIGYLGMEWDDASVDAEFVEGDPTEGDEQHNVNPNRLVVSVRRDSKFNEALFLDSLSGESIDVLAESLKSGQRVPIEITNSYEILNGQRRWRAADLDRLRVLRGSDGACPVRRILVISIAGVQEK